jgi:isochorismate synthase
MGEAATLRCDTRVLDASRDLLAGARACCEGPLFVWEQPASGRAFAALGTVREFRAEGPDRFATIAAAARHVLGSVVPMDGDRRGLRVVGGFGFSERDGADAAFPSARWVLPRVVVHREDDRVEVTRIWENDSSECDRWLASFIATRRPFAAPPRLHAPPVTAAERATWRARVERIRVLLAGGSVQKVVLARRRELAALAPIDPAALLAPARDARPSCFSVWTRALDGTSLIAATPELLVRRRGRDVAASALAGTAPRAADPTLDARLGAELLTCPKNAREHAIVVNAVRAALATVADQVGATPRPELLVLPEAQHLATAVTGRARSEHDVLAIAGVLFPTPAVCGAPRTAARAIIEAEEPERGWYTGAAGWMDGAGDGELAVLLRSARVAGRTLTLWGGAGIVEGSDADAELAETEAKMAALVAPFVVAHSPAERAAHARAEVSP